MNQQIPPRPLTILPNVIGSEQLDQLMPMHARLDERGVITHAGPSLAKLAGARTLVGLGATEAFVFRRPRGLRRPEAVLMSTNRALHLRFASGRNTQMRGMAVPVGGGGGILNLSLDLSELSDLSQYRLSCTDFAPTDMTVDMLYLIEAKSSAMAETRRLIQRLECARHAAETQAVTDPLTGLHNRRGLDGILARLVAEKRHFALTQLDLDHFKQVNDTLGHGAGDHVLRTAAHVLTENNRTTDHVGRVGGDEFMIIYEGVTDPEILTRTGMRLIQCLGQPIDYQGETCRVSASLGTTTTALYRAIDTARMIEDADRALYISKREGRGRHVMFRPSMQDPAGVDRRAG